jgi:hypothetical protein
MSADGLIVVRAKSLPNGEVNYFGPYQYNMTLINAREAVLEAYDNLGRLPSARELVDGWSDPFFDEDENDCGADSAVYLDFDSGFAEFDVTTLMALKEHKEQDDLAAFLDRFASFLEQDESEYVQRARIEAIRSAIRDEDAHEADDSDDNYKALTFRIPLDTFITIFRDTGE